MLHVQFEYKLEDLQEAHAAHKPKVHPVSGKSAAGIAVPLLVFLGLTAFFCLLCYGTSSARAGVEMTWRRRSLFLDMIMPMAAFLAFFSPFLLYRGLKAHGVGGLLKAGFVKGVFGWFLVSTVLVLSWLLLRKLDPVDDEVAPLVITWRDVSEVLMPHSVWFLMMFAFCWFIYRFTDRQVENLWKGASNLHRPFSLEVSDYGMVLAEPLARYELRWYLFERVIETKNLFLLYVGEQSFHIIPKRAFADAEQLGLFGALLHNHVTHRPTAFPVLPVASKAA